MDSKALEKMYKKWEALEKECAAEEQAELEAGNAAKLQQSQRSGSSSNSSGSSSGGAGGSSSSSAQRGFLYMPSHVNRLKALFDPELGSQTSLQSNLRRFQGPAVGTADQLIHAKAPLHQSIHHRLAPGSPEIGQSSIGVIPS